MRRIPNPNNLSEWSHSREEKQEDVLYSQNEMQVNSIIYYTIGEDNATEIQRFYFSTYIIYGVYC